ncbi:MAG TPA: hypothetical protein VK670_12255 [Silvibacterium sp.]|nr:hypothetical protein [Silvibacterium sp.]
MTSTSNWNNTSGFTVVAYFSSAEDAQNAINELVDADFAADQIGAVFHSRGGAAAAGLDTGSHSSPNRPHHDEMTQVGSIGSAAGTSGAESDTSGVTPSGLSTGGGTGFTGASRPGPIPGSEIPRNLSSGSSSSVESTGASSTSGLSQRELDESYGELSAAPSSVEDVDTSESAERRTDFHESWWDKLKHVFSGDAERKREPQAEKGAANFGTGEGRLGVVEYDYPYSGSAFESSFSSMGIPEARARRLSRVIGQGGAIVTVVAESRQTEAEEILERNRGQIREEQGSIAQDEETYALSEPGRVQVFGRVQRVYPGYIDTSSTPSGVPARKAS